MKAVLLTAYGDVGQLDLGRVPDPKPGPNQIKVRMAGASVNPVDWKLRSGSLAKMIPLQLPAILGRDASGVVVEVGAGVTRFTVGAKVLGLVTNAYAEFIVADADAWAMVPDGINLTDAAALPLVLLTGAQLVEDALAVRPGDTVLVTGATGSVGRAAVFVARARGATVWAGVRHAHKEEAAKLGAVGVVALDDPGDVDRLPELDAIADTVGGQTIGKLLGKVKRDGIIGSIVGEPAGAKERGLLVRVMWTHPDAKRLGELAQAVADGRLMIPIAKRLPLSRAAEAQTLAEHHAGGKVVLTA